MNYTFEYDFLISSTSASPFGLINVAGWPWHTIELKGLIKVYIKIIQA